MADAEFLSTAECQDQLFAWFQSLPLANGYETIHELSDGEAFVEALKYLDLEHFLDLPAASEDHVDRAIFMQVLRDKMTEYIEEKQRDIQKYPGASLRNLRDRIQEDLEIGGTAAIGRMLQLVLVCAVLSPEKEEHITKMRDLDEKVAVALSEAILQILPVQNGESEPSAVHPEHNSLVNDWCDKCATLESELSQLNDERKRLMAANARLKTDLDSAVDFDNERSPANKKLSQLQKETGALQESLAKVELSRDEFRAKCEELQDQLTSTVVESEQLRKKVLEIDRLRDELNEWKQTARQLQKYEDELKLYKRKIEDVGELRQQMKAVESRNTQLMKQNLELEQENAQVAFLKSEVDALRKENGNREQEKKLSVKRLESAQQLICDLEDQISSLEKQQRILESERSTIQRKSEDLDDGIPVGLDLESELLPPSVKEDMLRLKMENSELTIKLKNQLASRPSEASNATAEPVEQDNVGNESVSSADVECMTDVLVQTDVLTSCSSDALIAQRDAQIQALENELQFTRRNYGQQQKLITAAWYRMSIKMEQQASNARLLAATSDFDRPLSFLEEQRRAVNAPVTNGSRAANPATLGQISAYRTTSRSFLR